MKLPLLALLAASALASPALAQSKGDFTLGLGLGYVDPKSDNGTLNGGGLGLLPIEVGSNVRPTLTFEYFVMDNLGLEVLAATPFEHDIKVKGVGKIGSTKHLPPTVSLNYHFAGMGKFAPFLGAGLNYTVFFSERATGPIAGSNLRLEDSFGVALHAGFDYWLTDSSALRADVRWMDIDTDVKLNGTKIGTVEIDPAVVGVSYIMKF